ncbi:hypothetical protein BGX38DRAFT_1154504, partial [Terfezia claveryi]
MAITNVQAIRMNLTNVQSTVIIPVCGFPIHHPMIGQDLHPTNTSHALTIYELLSESKYTTKAFRIIKDDEELSEFFKDTKANMT